jgi:hypothetical protein
VNIEQLSLSHCLIAFKDVLQVSTVVVVVVVVLVAYHLQLEFQCLTQVVSIIVRLWILRQHTPRDVAKYRSLHCVVYRLPAVKTPL